MIKQWGVISGEDIRKENQLEKFVMINDFIAAGYGVASLSTQEYEQIGETSVKAQDKGSIAVVGPGTGLGEAYLVNVNGAYEPYASEGGHADLAVQT